MINTTAQRYNTFICALLALACGYGAWRALAYTQIVVKKITIPLSVYNTPEQLTLQFPERIDATVIGPRNTVSLLENSEAPDLIVHVNGSTITEAGTHTISLSETGQLFLRDGIHLINYNPQEITIHAQHVKTTTQES